jgi:hypothetical protein
MPAPTTMLNTTQLKNRREDILEEMRSIRVLKRGQLSEQMLRRTAADGSIQERGPYFSFQCWQDGKNCCQRVPAEKVPAVREAVAGYHKLKALTEEFAGLTETLCERDGPLLPAKKNSTRPRTRRSSAKRSLSPKSPPGV